MATPTWCKPVGYEVVLKSLNWPDSDPSVLPLTDFTRRTHAGHLSKGGVGVFHGLPEPFRGIEARMLHQVGIVNDEISPGGCALDGPSHFRRICAS